MKRKICLATLTLTAGLMMVFAASPAPKAADPCTDKYNSCKEICSNALARAKATGSTPENAENRFNACVSECDKAKKDCESKSGHAASPAPTPKPKK